MVILLSVSFLLETNYQESHKFKILDPQTWNSTTKLKLEHNLGVPVYLKLENLQVPGSFKIRGIGLTCQIAKENGFKRLVGSSGGNAGLAMAYGGVHVF